MSNEVTNDVVHPSDSTGHRREPTREPDTERLCFTPPIDIFEGEDGLVLHADLPGVTAESLDLQVQDNKLTLFGRVEQYVSDDAVALHREYHVGDFLRSFILSDEVDHEKITATLNNGVLKVTLPKAAKTQPRRIHVNGNSSEG